MLPSRSLSSRTISALLECPESDISNCSISSDQQRSRCEESEEVFLLLCATATPRRATEPPNNNSFFFIKLQPNLIRSTASVLGPGEATVKGMTHGSRVGVQS